MCVDKTQKLKNHTHTEIRRNIYATNVHIKLKKKIEGTPNKYTPQMSSPKHVRVVLYSKNVQVGNDQETAQSDRSSHSKNRGMGKT